MTNLDDREKGFEAKFAHDEEQEFKATARRNRMLGEWAARRMGLENGDDYAQAVVKSDFEQPGDEDVLRKISHDFKASGITTPQSEIRAKMDELLAIARAQVREGL